MSGTTPPAWEVAGAAATFRGPSSCILEAVVGLVSAKAWGCGAEAVLPVRSCSLRRSRCRCSLS
eukprot:15468075-Alexandrium_andersonii.AAC.1